MILYGDYHTHTNYSRKNHGKSSIIENAKSAFDKGLKEIAITDHGFGHSLYGVRRKDIPNVIEEIEKAKEATGVNILLGVEANLISHKGDIDILESDLEDLDILLMGFHRGAQQKTFDDFYKLKLINALTSPFKPTKIQINRNTTAYLRALEKYPIDIITHLNHHFPVDALSVARLAKERNTFIELNGKGIEMEDRDIEIMAGEGVKFIVNSDAHSAERVGDCRNGMNTVFRLGIPLEQVVNIDKLPNFKRKRG